MDTNAVFILTVNNYIQVRDTYNSVVAYFKRDFKILALWIPSSIIGLMVFLNSIPYGAFNHNLTTSECATYDWLFIISMILLGLFVVLLIINNVFYVIKYTTFNVANFEHSSASFIKKYTMTHIRNYFNINKYAIIYINVYLLFIALSLYD